MTKLRSHGVHHLALGARDVGGLATFYEQALGLKRSRSHFETTGALRSIWLELGPAESGEGVLMVERTHEHTASRPGPSVAPGWFLLAFSVNPAERAEIEAQIEKAGGRVESRSEYSSYARDPEDNRFAISCYPLGESSMT